MSKWPVYRRGLSQANCRRLKPRAAERKKRIAAADKALSLSGGDKDRSVTKDALDKVKAATDFKELATMAAENAVYEKLLQGSRAQARSV